MIISGKFFPSQAKEEKVFLLIRKHWFNYVIFVMLAILMLAPVVAFLAFWSLNPEFLTPLGGDIAIVLISAYFLTILGIELYGIVSYYLDVYIVTDRRIVDINQKGFFSRDISELHLMQVQDVSAHVDGFFKTILHFGDVYIQTAGERENFVFQSIPHPYTVAKRIIDLHEGHIKTKSSKKMPPQDGGGMEGEEPDHGLAIGDIEQKARKVLRGYSLKERIKTSGVFTAKDTESSAEPKIPEDEMPLVSDVLEYGSRTTGPEDSTELQEGREISLK
jgi:hypothetical protein